VETVVTYHPYGGVHDLFLGRNREIVVEGPAGTGKSRGALEKVNLCAHKYPGCRWLLVRKTLASLKASTLVTYRRKVLHPLDGVHFWAARAEQPAHYAYPNGSEVVIGGMDKADKVMSTEYDGILFDEAVGPNGANLDDWESLLTRLRNGVMPYQQIIGCVNPGPPTHWLNERMNSGLCRRIITHHEDNPSITEDYLETLRNLTGVRRKRLYLGIWAAAEGGVYEDYWDPSKHVIDRIPIPREWPRYITIDFGFTHAFVCQWWAEDPDGRLYRYREIYRTKRLVKQHAEDIKRASGWKPGELGANMLTLTGDPMPRAIICDPEDAEGRATLEYGLGVRTTPAHKAVAIGIQSVQHRLMTQSDGKPRLFFMRDSLVGGRDPELVDVHKPCCTEEEFDGYTWDTRNGGKYGDVPVKEDDHGMDDTRYMVAYKDLHPNTVTYITKPW
jgi:hypothetical protein